MCNQLLRPDAIDIDYCNLDVQEESVLQTDQNLANSHRTAMFHYYDEDSSKLIFMHHK